MKTIEERAKEYAKTEYEQFGAFPEIVARESYTKGATEQKAIDDAQCVNKVLMGKGSSINYYEQGFHDAIEKACKACENELRRLEILLNESVGVPANLISVGKSLSKIRREMEESL